ncbi:hypothetical protein PR048_013103 [Dryococelus australis]|uniref:Integrase zinc-binding domain-containing protein n=1 Tax=Dryococelus australis TaxID=614101 RepID=A0ABQ9HR95_9NEOP|nr:hypothetical protein PR048_013103 [Dryococelus australis]
MFQEYRNTPLPGLDWCLVQLLFKRRLQTKLHVSYNFLKPKVIQPRYVVQALGFKEQQMKNAHDRTAHKQEAKFVQGEKVFVRTSRYDTWKPGMTVEQHPSPCIYLVLMLEGNTDRHNVIHIQRFKVSHMPREATPVLMEMDYETKSEGDEFHTSSKQLRQSPCSSPSEPDFRGFEQSIRAADEDELVVHNEIIFKGKQVMRQYILQLIHYNHMGIQKECVFWQFMTKELTTLVNSCPTCSVTQNANSREIHTNGEVLQGPWQV